MQSVSYFTLAVPHRTHLSGDGGDHARSTTQLAVGAVIALGMAIVGPARAARRSTWRKPSSSGTNPCSQRRTRRSVIVSVCSSGDTLIRKGAICSSNKRQPTREASAAAAGTSARQEGQVAVSKAPLRAPVNELPLWDGEICEPYIAKLNATHGSDRNRGRDWPDLVGRRDVKLVPMDGSEMSSPAISRPAE